ncbi:kinase domain protein (macronuclear) [Tetrahymena thermophila SB210]|uniref:Kinase domain protein n=1 Tax=Tetrahymena thermophila (strain SB210) TaxID=312017 RepID=Q224J3_TETTS|nr:kinase domain protein [Tetrahymena thermophila SB210]EAR80709.1 kinase domain protein [Tetrahymena thermophila SB210]|eukprot:XP_001028372.1 kinase domain protein [Tetrahymena thermophila SB210]
MGNFLYQAPECFDPADPFIGKVYHDEYLKLGVSVRQQPSNRGIDFSLAQNKHKPLKYDGEFQNFVYHKQLKYIIDGLTNFVPKDRMPIKEALIILKGIISFEFQLDEMLIETIDGNIQQFTRSLKNEIEFVKDLSNKFYPIIKNEQTLNQELKEDREKRQYVNQAILFKISSIFSKQYLKRRQKQKNYRKQISNNNKELMNKKKPLKIYQPNYNNIRISQ